MRSEAARKKRLNQLRDTAMLVCQRTGIGMRVALHVLGAATDPQYGIQPQAITRHQMLKAKAKKFGSGSFSATRQGYEAGVQMAEPVLAAQLREAVVYLADSPRTKSTLMEAFEHLLAGKAQPMMSVAGFAMAVAALAEQEVALLSKEEVTQPLAAKLTIALDDFSRFFMRYAVIMEAQEMTAIFESLYMRSYSMIETLPLLKQAIFEAMKRQIRPPRPYYVKGLCRSFTVGRGCTHKDGTFACPKVHLCLEDACKVVPQRHPWANCDRLANLFGHGNGSGDTKPYTHALNARKGSDSARSRSGGYGKPQGRYNSHRAKNNKRSGSKKKGGK